MSKIESGLWTIHDLAAQAALALAQHGLDQPSGRVSQAPDLRVIRYYTTLGLLDPPAEMRGRTAYYGRRHLLQLLAIKREQARGLSLVEIQQRLLGLSNARLARVAGATLERGAESPPPMSSPASPPSEREDFWLSSPAPLDPLSPEPALHPAVWQGVPLARDVSLLLEPARSITNEDVESIHVAAGPLIEVLHRLRLIHPKGDPS